MSYLKLIKLPFSLWLALFLILESLDGCYTQLAITSDEQTPDANSSTIIDQPVPGSCYPLPYIQTDQYPANSYPSTIPAGSLVSPHADGTDTQSSSSNRQSGYQRPSASEQNTSRQAEPTPSRTSWSPAPSSQQSTTSTNSSVPARTTGESRGRK